MYKILKKVFAFVILIIFSSPVFAIDCEYPSAGLTISYDENSEPKIDYDKFSSSNYYQDLGSIAKWGHGTFSTEEIEIDQTLFSKFQGYACPSDMHMCEYSEWSLKLPSLVSLGYDIADVFTQIPCWMGKINDSACNKINEESYSALHLGTKKLYIYTQEEYQNSKLSKYAGGVLTSDLEESYDNAYDKCGGNKGGIGWHVLGNICGNLWQVADGVALETLIRDGIDVVTYKESICNVVPYEGPYIPINVNCAQLTQKIFKYREFLNEYTNCNKERACEAQAIKDMNEVEEGIKNYCSNILQNYDYEDGQAGCIDSCLTIKETLNFFKKGTALYEDGSDLDSCDDFSKRLFVWASNILRWIKYILPVAVIIFGILDFIKAIGADKDDEMKKAQKRFIIRLIAAALVFIIPLILEFVLDKMGFGYDDCGLWFNVK